MMLLTETFMFLVFRIIFFSVCVWMGKEESFEAISYADADIALLLFPDSICRTQLRVRSTFMFYMYEKRIRNRASCTRSH